MIRALAILLASVLGAHGKAIEEYDIIVAGPSRVIDGDTLRVDNVAVRLKGVDAEERGTPRGEAAKRAMEEIVKGQDLYCRLTGERTHRREVGYCFTSENLDLNRAIIEAGAALACPRYDARYMKYERPELVAAQPRSSYCIRREKGK